MAERALKVETPGEPAAEGGAKLKPVPKKAKPEPAAEGGAKRPARAADVDATSIKAPVFTDEGWVVPAPTPPKAA